MRKNAIGIDIGGTTTAVAAVDHTGRIHARAEFDTRSDRGFTPGFAQLLQAIHGVLSEANWVADTLSGIGIGCAGPVNPLRGTMHNPSTLTDWEDADIVSPLGQAFNVPVRMENDADAAALGEFQFVARRDASPRAMVTTRP